MLKQLSKATGQVQEHYDLSFWLYPVMLKRMHYKEILGNQEFNFQTIKIQYLGKISNLQHEIRFFST